MIRFLAEEYVFHLYGYDPAGGWGRLEWDTDTSLPASRIQSHRDLGSNHSRVTKQHHLASLSPGCYLKSGHWSLLPPQDVTQIIRPVVNTVPLDRCDPLLLFCSLEAMVRKGRSEEPSLGRLPGKLASRVSLNARQNPSSSDNWVSVSCWFRSVSAVRLCIWWSA